MKITKLSLITLLFYPLWASAQTIGDIANTVTEQLHNVPQFLGAIAYVCGIAMVIKGLFKLKEHNESKGQVKLHIPIIWVISGVLLLTLPTLINTGMEAFGFDQAPQATQKY